jgi:glycine cleavage system aminomethyltransferase T
MVITGHPSQIRDQAFLRSHCSPNWHCAVVDVTSAFSLLSLHGPKSRALLQHMSSDDLNNAAFSFGAARHIDVGHARAWAVRRSFFGELGYELLIPTEFTAHVYEKLLDTGAAHRLKHAGLFAMNHCRMEKAFRHFGHDIGEEDTPLETGLGFAVDVKKPDLPGKQRLTEQKALGAKLPYRTVAVAVRDADKHKGPFLMHNETIWKDGALVGHVTSGAWGFRTGRSLGLASLHREGGVAKSWIEVGGFTVMVAGERHALEVQLQPFYDPAGERMRS